MLYPNIETYCELDEGNNKYNASYLEKNFNQIIDKTPVITKEFIHKVNTEIVPGKTSICGKKLKTRRLIYLSGLTTLFLFSIFGTVSFWFTDLMNELVYTQLVIRNNTDSFDMWQKPPPKPLYKVYLFNYTNTQNYQNGFDTKLKVQEIGPYVYEQTVERVNVEFDEDTITYQQKNSFDFRPDLTKGKQSDRVVVPNIPLIAGAALSRNMNYFSRLGLSALFNALNEQPFIELAADSYIIGYDSKINSFSKLSEPFTDVKSPEKVGLMFQKIGLQPHVYTMHTGKEIKKFATFDQINGDDKVHFFSTSECNSISSTDGSIFPPKKVQAKDTLQFFFPEMCRRYPLVFNKEITIFEGKVPAYEYVIPEHLYNYSIPENQCYCSINGTQCPLSGVYNISACTQGIPMFASNPHFYQGDSKLFTHIDGLNPEGNDYKTRMNLQPRIGFMMTGRSTIQVNLQVQPVYPIHQLDFFPDGIILPLAWFDVVIEEDFLPPKFVDLIHQASFTVPRIEEALKYGTLLTTFVTALCIALLLKRMVTERKITLSSRSVS